MQLTAGLLFMALVLLAGIALQRFLRQRRDYLLQSNIIASANCCVAVTDAMAPRHPIVCVNPNWRCHRPQPNLSPYTKYRARN